MKRIKQENMHAWEEEEEEDKEKKWALKATKKIVLLMDNDKEQ